MKNRKYLFFDIDGTLVDENKQMPESTKRTLDQLKQNGHFVAIATSRPYCLTYEQAKSLDISNYVCDGGDGIVIDDHVDVLRPLNLEDALMCAKECLENKFPIASSIDTTNYRYSFDGRFISLHPELKDAFDFKTKEDFDVLKASRIHKMCIHASIEDEIKIPSLKKLPHYRLSATCILVEATYKFKGIQEMIEKVNGNLEDVIVFGDGFNDLEMFEHAPFSVAMGNAVDPLKRLASMVTKDIHEDGIEYACQYLNLI